MRQNSGTIFASFLIEIKNYFTESYLLTLHIMFKTDNMLLDHGARDLCRKLRKSQTSAELLFWERVRDRKFRGLKFYRQCPIFYELNNHESFFITDFFCFDKKTVIEIDGKIHNIQLKKDEERSTILNILGLRVVRIKNEEIEYNIKKVLGKLSLYLENINKDFG